MSDVTLQINLCSGDLDYAEQTVPAIVDVHRDDVEEVLVVADECRPQSTPLVHAPSRHPQPTFGERVGRLRVFCERLVDRGVVDRVVSLAPCPRALRRLNRRYAGRSTSWSHDHLGHAFSAYFLGWEAVRTRYVLHADADVLFHQAPGFRWVAAAVAALEADASVLAVSPRIAPPDPMLGGRHMVHVGLSGSGWSSTWALEPSAVGWRGDWFSTRCHLLDRSRLERLLPLVPRGGRAALAAAHVVNAIASPTYSWAAWTNPADGGRARRVVRRILQRVGRRTIPAFPLPPEVLLYERAIEAGVVCLYLRDSRAWILHPDSKGQRFLDLLPSLSEAVRRGEYPDGQRGLAAVRLSAWSEGVVCR